MSENFMEISKEDIEKIGNAIQNESVNYQLNDVDFSADTFESGLDVVLLQNIADQEFELVFETKYDDGKYYISNTFEIIKEDILNPQEPRDVFQSVNKYFHDVVNNRNDDFSDEKESLINFLLLVDEYDEKQLQNDLDPSKIREDYDSDYEKIYADDSLNRVQKSLALKELFHMAICQVVNDIELFFTRPFDLTPEEESEKNRQEAKALENELKLY